MDKKYTPAQEASALIVLGLILFVSFFASPSSPASAAQTAQGATQLTHEEITGLIKPAIVRIIHERKGTTTVPQFLPDFKTLGVHVAPGLPPLELPANDVRTGTGFIVNSGGYILTNAHLVSDADVTEEAISYISDRFLLYAYFRTFTSQEREALRALDDDEYETLENAVKDFVRQNLQVNIRRRLAILNPSASSTAEKIDDVFKEGIPATITSVNDNHLKDDKDVALIHVIENNLPALFLGESDTVSVGHSVTVFGFPAGSDFNRNKLSDPVITQGIISAIRLSEKKEFNIFETDAKIGPGSSGGPMVDAKGAVVGITTFLSTPSHGDSFGFAIPANLGKQMLASSSIENIIDGYESHFRTGLDLLHNRHCKQAIAEFTLAKDTNPQFPVAGFVDPQIKQCTDLIAAGGSIDTRWDEFTEYLAGVESETWAVVGTVIVTVLALVVVIIRLMHRLRKDERFLNLVENQIVAERWRRDVEQNPSPR